MQVSWSYKYVLEFGFMLYVSGHTHKNRIDLGWDNFKE